MSVERSLDPPVQAAQERLARSRSALMRRMGGQRGAAPAQGTPAGDAEPPEAGGWLALARRAARSWWRRHPASALATLAEPALQRYAREKPLKLLGYAAAAGAATVVLKPWRLVPLTALLATVLRTSDLAGLAAALLTQKKANPRKEHTMNQRASEHETSPRLELDEAAIRAASQNLGEGAVTPGYGPWRDEIVRLLNGALATELVCVLRYKRHHFTADGVSSPKIKEEFLVHAHEEAAHADSIAERIVQLGGEPDMNPDSLSARSHAAYDTSTDLKDMVRANLVAERIAVETYRQMINLIGDKDPTTRRMLEGILAQEEEHADELKDWL